MMGLTPQQANALEIIRAHVAKGPAPTVAELRRGLGLSSKSGVVRLLRGLEERGRIRRIPNKVRAIEVLGDPASALAALRDLGPSELAQVIARAAGLLAEREGSAKAAITCHRIADRLPRGGAS